MTRHLLYGFSTAAWRRAMAGEERPWRVWWLLGIPVGLSTSALTLVAELLREEGMHAAGAAGDTVKVLVFAAWLVAVWRCAKKTENRSWRAVSRGGVLLCLALVSATS